MKCPKCIIEIYLSLRLQILIAEIKNNTNIIKNESIVETKISLVTFWPKVNSNMSFHPWTVSLLIETKVIPSKLMYLFKTRMKLNHKSIKHIFTIYRESESRGRSIIQPLYIIKNKNIFILVDYFMNFENFHKYFHETSYLNFCKKKKMISLWGPSFKLFSFYKGFLKVLKY